MYGERHRFFFQYGNPSVYWVSEELEVFADEKQYYFYELLFFSMAVCFFCYTQLSALRSEISLGHISRPNYCQRFVREICYDHNNGN